MRRDTRKARLDETWAPKGTAPCLSFSLLSAQLSLPVSAVRVRERVGGKAQVPAGFC